MAFVSYAGFWLANNAFSQSCFQVESVEHSLDNKTKRVLSDLTTQCTLIARVSLETIYFDSQ